MQRCLGLGDLDLGRREPGGLGTLAQPAREERLATAVVTAHCLEVRAAACDGAKLAIDGRGQTIETDGEGIQATLRDSPAPQRVDDLVAALRARERHVAERSPNCSRRSSPSSTTSPVSSSMLSTG